MAVPKISFLLTIGFISWLIIFITFAVILFILGYRNVKKIILGSIIEIIGIFIIGSITFPLTLFIINDTAVQTDPWMFQTTMYFLIGALLILILNILLGKYFFKLSIGKSILFSFLFAILLNPVWFPTKIFESAKNYYPGSWYNMQGDGTRFSPP
jgi:hypothetical protein